MRRFLTLLIPIVLLTSGCAIPGTNIQIPWLPNLWGGPEVTEFQHDVMVIRSLMANPSTTLRAGQNIRLMAYIENLQKPESEPQKDVVVNLYNDCGLFDVKGGICSGGVWNKEGNICTITKMYPKSTAIAEWILTAKSGGEGVKVQTPCDVGVLVEYRYTTYTTHSVTFVNKAELERIISSGKTLSERGKTVVGEGPVKSYVEVLNQPILVDTSVGVTGGKTGVDAGSGLSTFWISNKGSGQLYTTIPESGKTNVCFGKNCIPPQGAQILADNKKMIRIEMTSPMLRADYKVETGNKEETRTGSIQDCMTYKINRNLQLIGKDSPKYTCKIYLVEPKQVKQEKTYQINTEVEYTYRFTDKITLTIEPEFKL